MKKPSLLLCTAILAFGTLPLADAYAQVPEKIHYQGHVAAGGEPFTGTGWFKFAIVDDGNQHVETATATATVTNGFVTSIAVTKGGSGYTAPPTVTISGGGGSRRGRLCRCGRRRGGSDPCK